MNKLAPVIFIALVMIMIGFQSLEADDMIDLTAALVWPVTIATIVLIFKEEIKTIIKNTRQLELGSFLSLIIDDASDETDQAPSDTPSDASDETDEASSDTPSDDSKETDTKHYSHAAVLKSWRNLEVFAKKKVTELLPEEESYQHPLARPIDYLQYKGVFTSSDNNTIYQLRLFRNFIAHGNLPTVSAKHVDRYRRRVAKIRRRIADITILPNIKLNSLTLLVLEINQLIDSKEFHEISIKEVCAWIENENILPALAKRTENFSDFSPFFDGGPYSEFVDYYHKQMKKILNAYAGNEQRKWGIQNMGLCLLLAWTNELIQQGSGWYPNDM